MADRPKAMKDALRDTLKDLVALHGAPGFEQSLVQYFRQRVESLVDAVEVDRYGNVTATRRGRQDRPRLMISAHLDEIGFIVKGSSRTAFCVSIVWGAPPMRSCPAGACPSMATSGSSARRLVTCSRRKSRRGQPSWLTCISTWARPAPLMSPRWGSAWGP